MMRKQYSKSDIKNFVQQNPFASSLLSKKSTVVQEDDCLYVDTTLCFIEQNGAWFPSLRLLVTKKDALSSILPKVVVDKGAIKFVVNGADIMRPGITSCETFFKNDLVVVVDETVGQPIAVAKALYSSQELMDQKKGKVLDTLHHVGDEYWKK